MISTLLALLVLQDPAPTGRTRTVTYREDRMEVWLPVAEPGKNPTVAVSLPEESVETIVVSWSDSDLSLERRGGTLFLKLLRPADGDLHVLGASGTLYRFFLRAAGPGAPPDAHVRVVHPDRRRPTRASAVDLLRSMRLGEIPEDAAVRSSEELLHESPSSRLKLLHVYDAPPFLGFVLQLENSGGSPVRVDPSRWSAEGLLLIASARMRLDPGEGSEIYLVFRN